MLNLFFNVTYDLSLILYYSLFMLMTLWKPSTYSQFCFICW